METGSARGWAEARASSPSPSRALAPAGLTPAQVRGPSSVSPQHARPRRSSSAPAPAAAAHLGSSRRSEFPAGSELTSSWGLIDEQRRAEPMHPGPKQWRTGPPSATRGPLSRALPDVCAAVCPSYVQIDLIAEPRFLHMTNRLDSLRPPASVAPIIRPSVET